jgi:hypothetical protein
MTASTPTRTWHAGGGAVGRGHNVPILVTLQLPAQEGRGGAVPDRVEQPAEAQLARLLRRVVSQHHAPKHVVVAAGAVRLEHLRVPQHLVVACVRAWVVVVAVCVCVCVCV